jgi:putative membrane protein
VTEPTARSEGGSPAGRPAGPPGAPGAPGPPPAEPAVWHRLHPLTPVVRGWKVVAVLLAVTTQQRGDEFLREGLPSRQDALISLGLVVVAAVIGGVYAVLAWRRSRYRIDQDSLQLQTGVLFRQERHARLDRLQAVDVVRPLLARFFGLAELRLEVAGGKGSGVGLSLLREDDAQQLRNTLLARAAGLEYEGERAPQAPEQEVLTVPVGRTIESFVRSGGSAVGLGLVVIIVVAGIITAQPVALAALVPVLLGTMSTGWARFTSAFGFRVAISPAGVRLRHGLLTTRSQTVPPGRVQAVRLAQPLLWRSRDWWRLTVNVAGYAGSAGGADDSGQGQQENVLLSVGTREEALLVLGLVLPALTDAQVADAQVADAQVADAQVADAQVADAQVADAYAGALTAGLAGTDGLAGFVTAPRSTRWLDPIGWRRHGVCVTDQVLLLRRGVLRRQVDVVPHARTQSLGVRQGPVQRRLGVATLALHSTAGPVKPEVAHLACADAAVLLDGQAERARTARAGAGDTHQGRWLPGVGGPPGVGGSAG